MHSRAVAFLSSLLTLCLALPVLPGLAAESVGTVSRLQGKGLLVGFNSVADLAVGAPVRPGDTLVTLVGSLAEVALADGSSLTLAQATVFSLDRFEYAPDRSVARAALRLVTGAFKAAVNKLGQVREPDFQVRTPLATIGIRGTTFWGGFLKADMFGVMLVQGRGVYVENDTGRVDLTAPGEGTWINLDTGAMKPVAQWTDQEKADAYATVTFR
ncbi:MAG: FecR family protein [Thermodesulfobacteriota bacterium]